MNQRETDPVVVVGAGLAGSRTCTELRKRGYGGPIVLIGDEATKPYDRPPLSKGVIRGKREPKPLKADYEGLDIDLRLETKAESVDLAGRRVLTSGGPIAFGSLVIATGATPVRLPGTGEQLLLRTGNDALALRDRLGSGARVVVIGAGWIGAEVAHAALERGCAVVGLEYQSAPLAQALGAEIGARFADWWGGTLRTGVRVAAVEPDGVHLEGGEVIPADTVVTGVGVRPATAWLAGSGLELLPAVAVDERLRAGVPDVYALGDAAAWWSPRFGRRMDVQHWDDAYSAPSVVAQGIIGGEGPESVHDPVPYFWSDQFGHRIEYVGHHSADDALAVDTVEGAWSARWTDAEGRLTAALAVDAPKLIPVLRKEIAAV
ncbi:FAD-dependent oxidoreductase [Amycolatopsis sp. GM8]|uniref:NAD(P)/FAD-dependent oxidoreductase n=1 Tax=Amycolatopsis sp. GM8 TaxID=2896530 RepID=UPI001F372DEE|nr:FAD-dependent oxidoreductase [Amycolatopsis sp. GM8]